MKIRFCEGNKIIDNLNKLPLLREPPDICILGDVEGVRIMSVDNGGNCVYIKNYEKTNSMLRLSLLLDCPVQAIKIKLWRGEEEEIETTIPIRRAIPFPEPWMSYHIKLPIVVTDIYNGNQFVECSADNKDTLVNDIVNDNIDIAWIIGPIAFGKTTLAGCMAEALREQGWMIKGDPTAPMGLLFEIMRKKDSANDVESLVSEVLKLPKYSDCKNNIAIILDEYDIIEKILGTSLLSSSLVNYLIKYIGRRNAACYNRTVLIVLGGPTVGLRREFASEDDKGICTSFQDKIGKLGLRGRCLILSNFNVSLIEKAIEYLPLDLEEKRIFASYLWNETLGHPMLTMYMLHSEMKKKIYGSGDEMCDAVKYCVEYKVIANNYNKYEKVPRFSNDIILNKIKECAKLVHGVPISFVNQDKTGILRFIEAMGLCYRYHDNMGRGYLKLISPIRRCYQEVE